VFVMGFGVSHEHRESMCTVLLFCRVQCIRITVIMFTACPLLLRKQTPGGLVITSSGLEVTYFWQILFYGQEFSWYTGNVYPVDLLL